MHGRRWFFRPVGLDGDDGGNEQERGNANKKENSENSTRPQEEINWHKLIWEDFLPNALTIGVPYELFWRLNPKKLKAFQIAFENKRKIRDEENWISWGVYGMSALSVVLGNVFSKNSRYVENPFLQSLKNKTKILTEEEKEQKTKELFMQLSIMESNYKMSKKTK